MNRTVTALAALLLAVAVILGALGAHAATAADFTAEFWRTAQFWHAVSALGLFGIGLGWNGLAPGLRALAAGLLAVGVLLFAGTLYWQALHGAPPFPGSAPAGGLSMILGWIAVAAAALRAPR